MRFNVNVSRSDDSSGFGMNTQVDAADILDACDQAKAKFRQNIEAAGFSTGAPAEAAPTVVAPPAAAEGS